MSTQVLPAVRPQPEWNETRVSAWRRRGLDLWSALGPELSDFVPREAVEQLLSSLIRLDNPACQDPSIAAHVMAQNDNLVVLARWAEAPPEILATALAAGLVHDLNKAPGEPLRRDDFAVRARDGQLFERVTTEAEVVGLNHYGERTRATLERLVQGDLVGETVAQEIDRCIVHHGLGSSRFIRALVHGRLGWGRGDFLDPDGQPRFVLPQQPRPTLATVLHDLADSAQQMQAGAAWISKYPLGYWRDTGATWAELLSGEGGEGELPTGLQGQLRIELETCQGILREAIEAGILHRASALRLERGVEALVAAGRAWVDARPETLALPNGETIYHQLAVAFGTSAFQIHDRLLELAPGDAPEVDHRVLRAAHALDEARARQLHAAVARRAAVVRRPSSTAS